MEETITYSILIILDKTTASCSCSIWRIRQMYKNDADFERVKIEKNKYT